MKRGHRKWHRRIWWVVVPAAAGLLVLALDSRVEVPANTPWPAVFAAPAPQAGG